MKNETKTDIWSRLLLILALLLPLIILFLLPGGGFFYGGIWFWFVLLLCFWLILSILGRPKEEMERMEKVTCAVSRKP